jgi:hypothetical protein
VKKLRGILERRLRSTEDLREAASLCRGLVLSDLDGAGTFLFLAFCFEDIQRRREGMPVDAGQYESAISQSLPLIASCLDAIEAFDPPAMVARMDSLARTLVRKPPAE